MGRCLAGGSKREAARRGAGVRGASVRCGPRVLKKPARVVSWTLEAKTLSPPAHLQLPALRELNLVLLVTEQCSRGPSPYRRAQRNARIWRGELGDKLIASSRISVMPTLCQFGICSVWLALKKVPDIYFKIAKQNFKVPILVILLKNFVLNYQKKQLMVTKKTLNSIEMSKM